MIIDVIMLVNGASASVKEGSVSVNVRMLLAEFIGLFVAFALAMFIPAGTLRWVAGWGFLFLFFGFVAIVSLWLLKHDPGLLQERMTGLRRRDQKKWDRVLMSLVYIFFILWLAIMPLDAVRFQWSQMPFWIQVAGALILIFSLYIFYLVIRENPYLSPAVRIQEERGKRVVSTGLYHYIRHPYYAASILFFLATTLMLGSWYGLIPGLVLTALL